LLNNSVKLIIFKKTKEPDRQQEGGIQFIRKDVRMMINTISVVKTAAKHKNKNQDDN